MTLYNRHVNLYLLIATMDVWYDSNHASSTWPCTETLYKGSIWWTNHGRSTSCFNVEILQSFDIQVSGLPQSLPNADQCQAMPIKTLALLPMSINSDQCQINSMIFIGIDWHWALVERVLRNVCLGEWSSHSASLFNDLLVKQQLLTGLTLPSDS